MTVNYVTKHVLVVDDTPSIRQSICKALQTEGCECHQAVNGFAALEELKKEHFDLVLTDYRMPLMDGMEFLKQLAGQQESYVSPLAIMMTSECDDAIQQQAMKASAFLALQKTCDVHQFVSRIMNVLARKPYS